MAKKQTTKTPQRKALPSKLHFALIRAPRIVESNLRQIESTLNLTRGKYAY